MFGDRLFLFVMALLQENVLIISTSTYICIITPCILFFNMCCYSDFTPKNQLPLVVQLGTAHTETDHKVGLGTEKEVGTRNQPNAAHSTLLGERHCAPRGQLKLLGA